MGREEEGGEEGEGKGERERRKWDNIGCTWMELQRGKRMEHRESKREKKRKSRSHYSHKIISTLIPSYMSTTSGVKMMLGTH